MVYDISITLRSNSAPLGERVNHIYAHMLPQWRRCWSWFRPSTPLIAFFSNIYDPFHHSIYLHTPTGPFKTILRRILPPAPSDYCCIRRNPSVLWSSSSYHGFKSILNDKEWEGVLCGAMSRRGRGIEI